MVSIAYGVVMADEAKKKNPLGPTGTTVADNIRRLRTGRGLAFTGLAERLAAIGRPIPTLGLRKLEAYERRVDADDLVALAVALDVSPVTLLMPPAEDSVDAVSVTGLAEPAAAIGVWEWLRGRFARPGGPNRMSIDTWPAWEQAEILAKYGEMGVRGDDK